MSKLPTNTLLAIGSLTLVLAACSSTSASNPVQGASQQLTATPHPSSTSSQPQPIQTESNPPGDIPDNQAFVTYTGKSGDYTVKTPEGWARTASGNGASFTDKLNTIAVSESSASRPPTVKDANNVVVPQLRQSQPSFSLDQVSTFTLPAGSGTLITYKVDSAANPVTNKVVRDAVERFTFWKNGKQVVLTLTGPENADNVDPWTLVSESFAWTK